MEVIWEDPPPKLVKAFDPNYVGVWETRLRPFLERPNEWGVVFDFETGDFDEDMVAPKRATAAARNLRRRKVRYQEGEWEFSARGTKVYAKCLKSEAKPAKTRNKRGANR